MVTRKSLYSWVRSGSLKLQVLLVLIIAVTVAVRVLPLEMQKRIVNEAINLRQVDLLLLYCGFYLAAVVTASLLKYVINILQTYIGERALAQMRKELYDHLLTLPLSFFRKTSPGTVVASLVQELAPAGEFIGQAIAVPVTNLLTLVAFAGYMFYLNPLLAGLSMALYPILVYVIPKMQRRTNRANKKRVDATRHLSARISEAVSGIHEIHANGSFGIENRKYSNFVDALFKIRIVWVLYRQGVKVLNNLFQNLGPFMLFVVGGYLAIKGRFDLGALVAFLSAYEKLYDPWKELMEFYQIYQDARIRYYKAMEYFDHRPEFRVAPEKPRLPIRLKGSVQVRDLSFEVSGGIRLLNGIDLDLRPGEHIAVVGFSGSGKSTLAQCISQLYSYTGGEVRLGGEEVAELPKQDVSHNIGYIAQSPFIFDGTIRENLLYACEADLQPDPASLPADAGDTEEFERAYTEALEKLREEKLPTLDRQIEVLQQTGLFTDVLRFGLNTQLSPDADSALVERLIRVRKNFQRHHGEELADFVEFFDEASYLRYSTVAANLLFGTPLHEDFSAGRFSDNAFFLDFLDTAQLRIPLQSLGAELATQTVDILGSLPPDAIFFEQSPMDPEELPAFKEVVDHLGRRLIHDLPAEERTMLLELGLRFTPGVHKLVALSPMLENLVLEGRARFRRKVESERPGAFSFYRMDEYIFSQSILDNVLFGKQTTDQPHAQERIGQSIIMLLIEEDLLETIVETGMRFGVGTKGDRLSGGQRQKLAIARSLLKEAPVLIMDEATSALDNKSQSRVQNLIDRNLKGKKTLISVVHRLDTIRRYDKIAVMKAGKIVEMGTYDDLIAKKGMLHELVHGSQRT